MKEKKSGIKDFFKAHFKANPLSYLGWLGFLGILGLFFGLILTPFLLCFSFFSYSKEIPDELFWKNVNRASARAFWWVFGFDLLVLVSQLIRGIWVWQTEELVDTVITETTVTMGIAQFDQTMILTLAFTANVFLIVLVFSISMMRFKKRERKLLEE